MLDKEDIDNVLVSSETPEGKKIEVFPVEGTSLWAIRFKSGGQLPEELSGKWVKRKDAVKEMSKYLNKRSKKKRKNGKNKKR